MIQIMVGHKFFWFRRRQWAWSDIEEFTRKRAFFRQSLRIRLKRGATIASPGFGGRSVAERQLAERRLAELNRRLMDRAEAAQVNGEGGGNG